MPTGKYRSKQYSLHVYVIDDPFLQYPESRLKPARFRYRKSVTLLALKRFVEETFDIPGARQVYHGVAERMICSTLCDGEVSCLRFNTVRILDRCDDHDYLRFNLVRLVEDGIIRDAQSVAVVRPPPANNLARGDGDDLWKMDTVAQRIEAGRNTAAVVNDEDSSGSEDGGEEGGQSPQNRARRVKNDNENQTETVRDDDGNGEAKPDQQEGAANDNSGKGEVETIEPGGGRADGAGGDEGRANEGNGGDDDVTADKEGGAEEATAAAKPEAQAAAEEAGPAPAPDVEENEEDGPPQKKRAREVRVKIEEDENQPAWDRNIPGEAEHDREEESTPNNSGIEEEEKANEDNEGDEGGDDDTAAQGGGAAAATEQEPPPAPGQLPPQVPSELHTWLLDPSTNGGHTDRFRDFADAFEQEFESLEELVLAADAPSVGLRVIFDRCGVTHLVDMANLDFAIGRLPRAANGNGTA